MELIDETINTYSVFADCVKDKENIMKRCNELKIKNPEKAPLFEGYVQNQASEYGNKADSSIMVLKRVKRSI